MYVLCMFDVCVVHSMNASIQLVQCYFTLKFVNTKQTLYIDIFKVHETILQGRRHISSIDK